MSKIHSKILLYLTQRIKGGKRPTMSNFIFYSIVFTLFVIAMIFAVLFGLDLKNDDFGKAGERLIVVCIMAFCIAMIFAILPLTHSLTL